MRWYYYLHTNGDLIGKNPIVVDAGYFDGPFVQKVWMIDFDKRDTLWTMMLEALAKGARVDRVKEIAEKQGCDKADSIEMLKRMKPNELMRGGMKIFIEKILGMDVEEYWKEVGALGEKDERTKKV